MAMSNFTGEGKQTETFQQLYCTEGLTIGIHKHLIYLSAFNVVLSIAAVLGNALILVALHKESSLHPPSKLLYRCLATTDLGVGLIVQPLGIVFMISLVHKEWNLCRYAYVSSFTAGYALSSVSLLTLTAISVDRLLALSLGLRYRQLLLLVKYQISLLCKRKEEYDMDSRSGGHMYTERQWVKTFVGSEPRNSILEVAW
ncbi:hypothetical protein ACROYT_G039732 [Oculina patagonica]